MKVIAVLSQKGGVGKTTLATCLAVAAEADGKTTAILDLDPQATASFWSDAREAEAPAVSSLQAVRLGPVIAAAAKHGTDLVIIDGAAVARDVAQMAAQFADLILIPTKAAVFDTMAMTHTLDIARQLDKPVAVVLTFVSPQGQETADAIEAMGQLGAEVCPVTIGNRKAFFRAQGQGLAAQEFERSGAAAKEVAALYDYTNIRLYGAAKESGQ
ncbi:nucleotide-binding protein [Novosphingobium sp. KACC 22771]|uniref:nucleotide-binding protein n=1 Tax=Novosphingobium sp. KACC 22771 TaxID=3025670 RepID=UPI00236576F3|nr:AAA family ATPase [Novosphingobium sp. KACC 22771]WDF71453.1 AAA family ATPase [Novosphingobium sp. KACC 22771]